MSKSRFQRLMDTVRELQWQFPEATFDITLPIPQPIIDEFFNEITQSAFFIPAQFENGEPIAQENVKMTRLKIPGFNGTLIFKPTENEQQQEEQQS